MSTSATPAHVAPRQFDGDRPADTARCTRDYRNFSGDFHHCSCYAALHNSKHISGWMSLKNCEFRLTVPGLATVLLQLIGPAPVADQATACAHIQH